MTPMTLLYVDDDADIRTIVGLSLALDPSIDVSIAATGAEALRQVADGLRPDVAVLDVMMPDIDGPELLGRLHGQAGLADLPIIFMTAKARANDLALYRARGAIGTILKPFDPLTLATEIRTLLGDAAGVHDGSGH